MALLQIHLYQIPIVVTKTLENLVFSTISEILRFKTSGSSQHLRGVNAIDTYDGKIRHKTTMCDVQFVSTWITERYSPAYVRLTVT